MSRRELLAAATSVVGGGLVAACASDQSDHRPPPGGTYSFHAPGSGLDDRRRLQEPIDDRLFLAGEAVGVNNPATVTGAVVSGRYAAGQLMHRLSG